MACAVGSRLGRHVHAVLLVAPLTVLLHLLVQFGQPLRHKVDVLYVSVGGGGLVGLPYLNI